MKNILLSSRAFINKEITQSFLNMLGDIDFASDQVIIIVNSVKEGKRHPKMIELQQTVRTLGFENVVLFDALSDNSDILKTAKAIILNGGYEFLLLDSLRKTGVISVLQGLTLKGTPLYGISAGAIVLGPDLDLYNELYPEDNINDDVDMTSISVTDIRIYPHYDVHSKLDHRLKNAIDEFEKKTQKSITRLTNEQGILIKNNKNILISPTR
ncbi:Type 1 glutamine amidotransferase-like domain-containing protein [Liquorilactobacillus mali]|uniref:Type 1 glutamine amidotransferase-like domain-containing protein n=1 Tax=Liquorilactobacillus mali TaxID=1618 RepID=UPI0029533E23|nr:Type 1 glutamine amidotransferase-like domain-containing protein [Liquorilactobacillus mali]MDV7758598.1 dipeptidase [Liquorilactobacillus mali]